MQSSRVYFQTPAAALLVYLFYHIFCGYAQPFFILIFHKSINKRLGMARFKSSLAY